jgi:hypothetical protein
MTQIIVIGDEHPLAVGEERRIELVIPMQIANRLANRLPKDMKRREGEDHMRYVFSIEGNSCD